MLQGKGMFIWQVQNCENGDAQRVVEVARAAGLTHLIVKIADGVHAFPGSAEHQTMLEDTIHACQTAGISVWGWQFIYGRDPRQPSVRTAVAEAQIAAAQVQRYALPGFVIDIENTGNAVWTWHGDATDAAMYSQNLRASLPDRLFALASHRFPQYHPNLPWQTLAAICNVMMPQVYWVGGDAAWNLRAAWEAYQARWPQLPFIPIGAAYGEGGWTASPDEITAFIDEAQSLNLPAVNFWSWQHARFDAANPTWPGTQLWDAVADHGFGGSLPVPPAPVTPTTLWVSYPLGLKFRRRPSPEPADWVDGIIIPCGTALTCYGPPTLPDSYCYRFQKVDTPDGRSGWVTHSSATETYLTSDAMLPPPPAGSASRQMRVTASWGLKFRRHTLLDDTFWIDETVFGPATVLTAIGLPGDVDRHGYRWQYVRALDGRVGWVGYSIDGEVYLVEAAEVTHFAPPPAGSPEKQVIVTAGLGLRLRSQTDTSDVYWLDQVAYGPGTVLSAIGSPTDVNYPGLNSGNGYRWHFVQDNADRQGWVIYAINDDIFLREVAGEAVSVLWSARRAAIYAEPSGAASLWRVAGDLPLQVLDDPHTIATSIGSPGARIHVRTPGLKRGYIDGADVRRGPESDARLSVNSTPPGEAPTIYGFHDTFDRGLFHGSNYKGWVLITEQVGKNPATAAGNRNTYVDWSNHGYGVIARLNYGYDRTGTIPEPRDYTTFAQTCATWVRNSLDPLHPNQGCHIWIIGNEMNNPREWPGNHNGSGGQVITPELYAACFNQVYAAIKAVQPNAVVIPGAVDPYNAIAGDTRDYFQRMLDAIDALDGFALHAYTHGSEPALITSEATFGDYPLTWQYYNFYAYRTFMDMIPGKWREVPVFITETDQVGPWASHRNGWVQAAYAEINRWNTTPHHQQIRALLLYRWWSVDPWAVEHNDSVKSDFRDSLQHDYRWRTSAREADFLTSGVSLAPPLIEPAFSFAFTAEATDDLTRIYGLGPRSAATLHDLGITRFAELAQLTPQQIRKRLHAIGLRGLSVRTWPEQARLLLEGDEDGLAALVARIRR